MAGLAIGAIAGVVCSFAISMKFRFGFDDSLDVIGVHLDGGPVGSLLIGFFADPSAFDLPFRAGLFFGGGVHLLGEQLLANGVTMIYSFGVTFVLAKALHATMGIRVPIDRESEGLDVTEHAETAYNHNERTMGRSN